MNDSFDSSFNDTKSLMSNKRLSRIILSDFEENDDTKEKKARKRESVMLNLSFSKNIHTKPKEIAKSNVFNADDILRHYGDCLKLASENKITPNNAFNLHLIDYLKDYMHNLQSFQVVSSTLDAGAKIYAGRVDIVHTDTYQILAGRDSYQGDNEVVQEVSDDVEEIKTKRIKKRPENTKKMTCTNLKKIRLTSAQIRSEVDPLFQSQAKKFDEGGTGELRLNNLKLLDDNYGLLLDFDSIVTTKCGDYADNEVFTNSFDITEFGQMLKDLSHKTIPISSEFDGFKFVGWDPTSEILNMDISESIKEFVTAEYEPMNIYEDDDMGGDDHMDHASIVIDNGEQMDVKQDGDGLMTSMVGGEEEAEDHMLTLGNSKLENGTSLYVSSVKEMVNSFMENYGEINDNILGMWAGPDHWKTKAKPIKLLGPETDKPRKHKPTKTKKEVASMFPAWVNSRLDEFGVGRLVDFEYEDVEARNTSVSTQLTDFWLNKNIQREYVLPARTQFAFKSINQLMNREVSLVNKALKKQAEQMSAIDMTEDQNNDKNNDGDDLFEVVPEQMMVVDDDGNVSCHDNLDCGGDDFDFEDCYAGNSLRNCNFDDFGEHDQALYNVHRPETVDINYAKTAKRINVKKLKLEIMSYLSDNIQTKDLATVTSNKYPDVHMSAQLCSLSNLLVTVDQNVSPDVSKELSVSILMTCLLHLANEMGLDIASKDDYSDFNLGQGFSEYDMAQISQFGIGNALYRDSRKRRTTLSNDDCDERGDKVDAVKGPKRRQSLFSLLSDIGDDEDSEDA